MTQRFFNLLLLFSLFSCSENDVIIDTNLDSSIKGTGVFEYSDYLPFGNKAMNVYYYVPNNPRVSTKIVFIFHGNGRNAKDYRDATIDKAKEFGFIVIAPEFSSANFPGGDQYNLANIFLDGDHPSLATLNPEEEWTFSVIEPLFDYLKKELNNTSLTYHIIGHSAGSQFAQRYLMFKQNIRVDKTVLSAAGWYTTPEKIVNFPYGVGKSPIENSNFSNFFSQNIIVQVGELDNNNNDASLRNNSIVDQQGLNRYQRANYFFNTSKSIADEKNLTLNWQFFVNQGLDHSYRPAVEKAVDYIFK